jgi:hypothetical protein
VDPDDGAIDDRVLEIGIAGQARENPLEAALQGLSAKALEDRVPVAECRGQVAPRRARARDPQYRFQEQPVVLSRPTRITGLAGA